MNSKPPTNKVTLEDLLRVKRAERPSAEFWENFESELRAKQLTAIIEKRTWWSSLHRQVWVRRGLATMGTAAAVIAVTIWNLPSATPSETSEPAIARQSEPVQLTLASPIVVEEIEAGAGFAFASAPALPVDLAMTDQQTADPEPVVAETQIPDSSRGVVTLASAPKLVSLNLAEPLIPPPSQTPVLASDFAVAVREGKTSADPLVTMPTPRERQNQTLMALQEASEVRTASLSLPVSNRASAVRQMNLQPQRSDITFGAGGNSFTIPF